MAPLLHNKWKWRLYTIVFVCKDNANEGNGSLLTISRVQLVLCKDNARWVQRQGRETPFYRA